jgi:hypothetical protein
VWSASIQNVYDFESHLIQHGGITYQYDKKLTKRASK